MNNEHITRFGDPVAPRGALYAMHDEEGVVQFYVDIARAALRAKGISITPEIEEQILELTLREQQGYHRHVDTEGIPEKLKSLFGFTKKSKAVRYCRQLQLSEHELYLLAHNCTQIGFSHQAKFKDYVPSHLDVLDEDIADLNSGNPRPFLKKTDSILLERKCIHVHFFEHGSAWHCFYFDYRDMGSDSTNHWKYGSHLHYVSYLWPNLDRDHIWSSFDKRFADIPSAVHIRFTPHEFPNP
jgi:hypothetical protein